MTTREDITIDQSGDVTVVSLGPTWDSLYEGQLPPISAALLEVARHADPPLVVVDLPHTKFVGSAFLGLLVQAVKTLKGRNGRLAVSSLSPYCTAAIGAAKLDELFEVFESAEEARLHLSR